jgi:hypothetical protein
MTYFHARMLAREVESTLHIVEPYVLGSPINDSSFALSGLQLACDYVVREFLHPTNPDLATFEPDFSQHSVNLLYSSVGPSRFAYTEDESFGLGEDGQEETHYIEDVYLVGMDFEDVLYPDQPFRRTFVPMDTLQFLNRILPTL